MIKMLTKEKCEDALNSLRNLERAENFRNWGGQVARQIKSDVIEKLIKEHFILVEDMRTITKDYNAIIKKNEELEFENERILNQLVEAQRVCKVKQDIIDRTRDDRLKKFPKIVVDYYGPEAQARIAMEECAELIQAVNKCLRYPDNEEKHTDLVEEMADVAIMFNQLMLIFNVKYDEFNVMIKKKTERILNRLEADKKKAEV